MSDQPKVASESLLRTADLPHKSFLWRLHWISQPFSSLSLEFSVLKLNTCTSRGRGVRQDTAAQQGVQNQIYRFTSSSAVLALCLYESACPRKLHQMTPTPWRGRGPVAGFKADSVKCGYGMSASVLASIPVFFVPTVIRIPYVFVGQPPTRSVDYRRQRETHSPRSE